MMFHRHTIVCACFRDFNAVVVVAAISLFSYLIQIYVGLTFFLVDFNDVIYSLTLR